MLEFQNHDLTANPSTYPATIGFLNLLSIINIDFKHYKLQVVEGAPGTTAPAGKPAAWYSTIIFLIGSFLQFPFFILHPVSSMCPSVLFLKALVLDVFPNFLG